MLTTDIVVVVTSSGMTIETLDAYDAEGDPEMHGWTFEGAATS